MYGSVFRFGGKSEKSKWDNANRNGIKNGFFKVDNSSDFLQIRHTNFLLDSISDEFNAKKKTNSN